MNNVLDFGAKGDGSTKDTKAIQRAIDAGGMVFLPAGTYLSGTLYLKSHGGLELAPGAVLLGSPDPDDYNKEDFCPQNSGSVAEVASGGHLIVAVEQEDITIRGPGKIDANADAWFGSQPMSAPGSIVYARPAWRPSQAIFFCECKDIWLRDFKLANAPYWSCFLHGCENATISGLHIWSDPKVLNDDGLDIDCCRHVTISDCIIDVGDDCIAIRGNDSRLKNKRPCEYVTISNCILKSGYANAVRVGVGNGTIRHCLFNNIAIHDTRTAVCIISKYSDKVEGRGTDISDITFRNMQVEVQRFANIKMDNRHSVKYPSKRTISNIVFSQITGSAELSTYVEGNFSGTMKEIRFADVSLRMDGEGAADNNNANGRWGCDSTSAAFELRDAEGVEFRDVRLEYVKPDCWKDDIHATGSKNIKVNDCNFAKGCTEE